MLLLGMWGFHSPIPCGCATIERGSHLNQVQAAVCLVPAHFSPASPGGLFGDGGMDKHHHSHPPGVLHSPCLTYVVWHVQGTLLCSQGAPRPLHAVPCCAIPCKAVPCSAVMCQVVPCHGMPCHALQAGRGASQTFWQKGPDAAPVGEALACAWALAAQCC